MTAPNRPAKKKNMTYPEVVTEKRCMGNSTKIPRLDAIRVVLSRKEKAQNLSFFTFCLL